jgi:simple sugar transport system permease protein
VGLSTAVAVVALALAMVVVAASGASATETLSAFFTGAFGGTNQIGSTLAKVVPLVLVALAWILVFSGGRFHVGFPGQMLIGGLLTAIVTVKVSGLPVALHVPLGVAAGMLGGGLYAAIVAWMWARRGVNEILSTLLLNLVAIQLLSWSVRGPLQQSAGILPQSDRLQEPALWPAFPGYTFLHWDVLLVPIAVAIVTFVLRSTTFGLRLRLVGANEVTARYAGTSPQRIGAIAIGSSGVLAGVAGSALIQAGDTHALTDGFDAGYGFQGIAVALLARNSPLGCIPAALLFAALRQGGGVVEAQVGVSSAVVDVTQGLVICFVTGAAGILYVLETRKQRSRRADSGAATPSGRPHETVGAA